jgi:hypothetical protein
MKFTKLQTRIGGDTRLQRWIHSSSPSWGWFLKLWCRRTTYPEVFETGRDASKATAEVACGRELSFDRLSRAVGSG